MTKEEEFRKKLLSIFVMESEEHLRNMIFCVMDLEKSPPPDKEKALI